MFPFSMYCDTDRSPLAYCMGLSSCQHHGIFGHLAFQVNLSEVLRFCGPEDDVLQPVGIQSDI